MREYELTLAVLCRLHINFYLVTYLEIRIVTELRSHYDTFTLVADVDDDLPLGDGHYCTLNHVVLNDLREGLVISCGDVGPVGVAIDARLALKCIPVKLIRGN